MAGRPRKPTQTKILQGTFRGSRAPKNEAKPPMVEQVPAPPAHLPRAGRELWKKLAPELQEQKLLTVVDLASLEMVCFAYGIYREMNAAIRTGGRSYQKYFKGQTSQTIPEWTALKTNLELFRTFAAEFGLTPASRTKIEVPEKPPKDKDPMEALIGAK